MIRLTIVMLAATLLTSGCYRAGLSVDGNPQPTRAPEIEFWDHHWLGGLIGSEDENAKTACADGVAFVKTKHSFLNSLVAIVTGGIYAPVTISVWCNGSADAIEVPLAPDFLQTLHERDPRGYDQMMFELERFQVQQARW